MHWIWHGLWREDGHVLRCAIDVAVESQASEWKIYKDLEEECLTVGLSREDAICGFWQIYPQKFFGAMWGIS